jgi:hypothetical protein
MPSRLGLGAAACNSRIESLKSLESSCSRDYPAPSPDKDCRCPCCCSQQGGKPGRRRNPGFRLLWWMGVFLAEAVPLSLMGTVRRADQWSQGRLAVEGCQCTLLQVQFALVGYLCQARHLFSLVYCTQNDLSCVQVGYTETWVAFDRYTSGVQDLQRTHAIAVPQPVSSNQK